MHEPGRIEKVKLHLPPGLRVTPAPDRSLADMLAKGDLDAVISARDPGGERLFPDYPPEELAYFRKTRIFPIMHVVVLRRDVYERDRWVAMNLMQAFEEAKDRSLARAAEIGASSVPVPWVSDHARRWREVAGEDFWPYGIEPNRPTLEAFLQYSFEQGICARRLQVEELFAPETLRAGEDLVGLDADLPDDLPVALVVAADERGELFRRSDERLEARPRRAACRSPPALAASWLFHFSISKELLPACPPDRTGRARSSSRSRDRTRRSSAAPGTRASAWRRRPRARAGGRP